jgi:hypothetical protein
VADFLLAATCADSRFEFPVQDWCIVFVEADGTFKKCAIFIDRTGIHTFDIGQQLLAGRKFLVGASVVVTAVFSGEMEPLPSDT